MKRAIWAPVVALPLILLLSFGLSRNPQASATPLVNKQAPQFTLQSLDGGRISLASLRGRPVVLNFWASWCADCTVEHPYLRQLKRVYAPLGVHFLGVSYQDGAASARSFMHRYGVDWPDVSDPGQQTAIEFGVTGVPETFVIDRSGVVRYHSPGPVAPNAPTTPQLLARQIDRVLARHS